jgi:hypothetical protein
MSRRLVGLGLLLTTTACTSLQPVLQPVEFVRQKQPTFVVITTADTQDGEDPLVIERPRIQDGALTGYLFGDPTQVPLPSIRAMQAKQYSKKRTMVAIAGGAVVLGAIGFMVANVGSSIDKTYCPPGRPGCENLPHVR